MDFLVQKITIEKKIIDREKFFILGFCPEIEYYAVSEPPNTRVGATRYAI